MDSLYNSSLLREDRFKQTKSSKKIVKRAETPFVVTRPEEIEFVGERKAPLKKTAPKNKIKYVRNSKKLLPHKLIDLSSMSTMSKFLWAFIFVLVLRLLFMDHGVYDFYSKENTLNDLKQERTMIDNENLALALEIEKIKKSPRYQKEITKEHLGVIEKGEFLVLFARD